MTPNVLANALSILLESIEKTGHPPLPLCGICTNVCHIIGGQTSNYEVATIIGQYASKWDLFSGDQEYPIPGGVQAFNEQLENHSFWIDIQGIQRIYLIHFIINQIAGVTL